MGRVIEKHPGLLTGVFFFARLPGYRGARTGNAGRA